MSSAPELHQHPVLAAVAVVDAALTDVVGVDPMFMSVAEKAEALLGLSAAIDRIEELRMRVLASADDLAARDGARDAAAWLAHHGRRDRGECRRRLRLARTLETRGSTGEALRDGVVNLAQAEVIAAAIEALPDRIDADVKDRAEERLVDEAARFGPRALRVLGRRVVDVVAPEVADALEQEALETEERRAARQCSVRTRRYGDGTNDILIRCGDLAHDRFLTYLNAHASPRRAGDDRRPYDQRLGSAFEAFLEHADPHRLPLHGGDATTVVVTIDLETLRTGVGTGLVGDQPVSAGQVRRLACTAGIIPVVLGGTSQVLDAGRMSRVFTPIQRRVLKATQHTCRADGCDIPADWCEAHHAGVPWAQGGRTDLADGLLLCSFHHHRAHDPRYAQTRHTDGRVRFHRQT